MDEFEWRYIPEFPDYQINDRGDIYNSRTQSMMKTSFTNHGHVKITLMTLGLEIDEETQEERVVKVRYTRSVAQLVAEAFVDPPNFMCDCVIILDGNLRNVQASNLAWRPRTFAWKYAHQLRTEQPLPYTNLRVANIIANIEYQSIIQAGMTEGLLFEDIWRSTYTGSKVFPYGAVFEITERV